VPVSDSVAASPQLWPAIAASLFSDLPELLLLCSPLPAGPASPVGGTGGGGAATRSRDGGDGDVPSSPAAAAGALLMRGAALLESGLAARALSGKVGECCDGAASAAAAARSRDSRSAAAGGGDVAVAHYGLVVQSRVASSVEGCYILKTVRSQAAGGGGGDGCGCTHFALSRVGRGEPLHAQLLNAWLV